MKAIVPQCDTADTRTMNPWLYKAEKRVDFVAAEI